ncbi:RrF2 family transcriptional regulator [Actinomadura chibensis]|uniref:Rrf2 family transcriptional regulator n=1 Tax=Actinomadura chibensis TaxID=392828 RepID=A0A5D0P059_9ACTN|nr:Rrf2 family transcriptional regulator [Actinomadura chibensis]TYB49671.1 Rrf2 family transcriptional regulator [Actinomadura chibensis]
MKLSQGVEWGLHCVVLLARMPAETVVRRTDLADYHGLAEPTLAKHLHSLTRAGLLHAVPGPKGGYRLGRPAADISVLDVVEAIDGTSRMFVCTEIRQRGTGALSPEQCGRPCLINAAMGDAERAWRDSLRTVTIAGLAARIPTPVTGGETA